MVDGTLQKFTKLLELYPQQIDVTLSLRKKMLLIKQTNYISKNSNLLVILHFTCNDSWLLNKFLPSGRHIMFSECGNNRRGML